MGAHGNETGRMLGVLWVGLGLVLGGCGVEARSETAAEAVPIEAMDVATPTVEDLEADLAQGLAVEPAPEPAVEERPEPVVTRRPPEAVRRADPEPAPRATEPTPRTEEPVLIGTGGEGSLPAVEPRPTFEVPVGSVLAVSMDGELNTEEHWAGDVFWATLLDDLIADDGLVLVPAGAGVKGRVVRSEPSADSDHPAEIEIEFDAIVMNGRELPIVATVLSVPLETSTRDSGRESAAKVVGGAAAGAILGRILGGGKDDAAKGAVVGAAAGAAVAAGTRDGHAKIPEGAVVEFELLRPIRLIS